MADTHRVPKQWSLTKRETINSFEKWRQNIIYTLKLDHNFSKFLEPDVAWEKASKKNPYRGFRDDPEESIPRQTAANKVAHLEMMLWQIANYCPVISRNTIVKYSTSIPQIWQAIRLHYGFLVKQKHGTELQSQTLASIHPEIS